jgi:hypothetical protein
MAIKKRQGPAGTVVGGTVAEICPMAIAYPNLYEFLTARSYEDQTPRTPGTLSLFVAQEGGLRACLNDKDTGEVAFVTGGTLSDLMYGADAVATGELGDWRKPKTYKKK